MLNTLNFKYYYIKIYICQGVKIVINMNLREIIIDAIKYPISDTRKFLIFCALIILMSLSTVLPSYGVKNDTLSLILSIVTLIVAFVVLGYSMDVIKGGTEHADTLPDFDYVKQFVLGIKSLILNLIYFIIPAVLVIIVASATGLFSSFTEIVLFSFLSFTAQGRFAKTESGTEGLRFREILRDISKVGLLKMIVTLIVIYIIALALVFVIGLIGLIPYIGVFISIFIGVPYVVLYIYRAIGLLYADA